MNQGKKHLSDYSDLMLDWCQEKNIGLDPDNITSGSHQKVLWHCHKCGREWYATVHNRVNGTGCTCDARERQVQKLRKMHVDQDGSLAKTRPEIAAQWHPTLNGSLTPEDITEKSMYKAWWLGDDGVAWQSVVSVRCRTKEGTKRPQALVIKGVNDLKTLRPDLVSEWNYEKNSDVDIERVMPGSKNKVWWICEKGHEWQATITSRSVGRGCPVCNRERNTSFPEQSVYYYVKQAFPDALNRYYPEKNLELDVYIPSQNIAIEYDGAFYHASEKKKSIDIKKNSRLKELNITLIRIIESGGDIPANTEYCILCDRKNNTALIGEAVKKLFELLQQLTGEKLTVSIDIERDRVDIYGQYILAEKANSLSVVAPEVILEWHPSKNGRIRPEFIHAKSNKIFWWKCKKCGYEWKASASRRTQGNGCPACAGNVVATGINDLQTKFPEIAAEWDYERNTTVSPSYIISGSGKKFWWRCHNCGYEWLDTPSSRIRNIKCPHCNTEEIIEKSPLKVREPVGVEKNLRPEDYLPYYPEIMDEWDDKKNNILPNQILAGSGKKYWWKCRICGYEWQAAPSNRARGTGCPQCAGKIVNEHNSLKAQYPKIAAEWAYDLNGEEKPENHLPGSDKKIWWRCSKGHTWQSAISHRLHNNCPYCGNKLLLAGFNDFATVHPELLSEWSDENEFKPTEILSGSNKKIKWICIKGHKWDASISNRIRGNGCPYCNNRKTVAGENDLESQYPDVASEWNFLKNRDLKPSDVTPGSNKKVWWKCNKCGGEWEAIIWSRVKGRGCPYCAGVKPVIGVSDLETKEPALAAEWNYEKNSPKRPRDYMPRSRDKVWWKCNKCGFEWEAPIGARTQGRYKCPKCNIALKHLNG